MNATPQQLTHIPDIMDEIPNKGGRYPGHLSIAKSGQFSRLL